MAAAPYLGGMSGTNIGALNTRFVLDDLKAERIDVTGQDVLDVVPRKVCFMPASGKAMIKRLARANFDAIAEQEFAAATRARPIATGGGAIDLFARARSP